MPCARFDHDLEHARTTLLQDGHVAPLFAVSTATEVVPLLADFRTEDSKRASLMAARLLCIAEDAWMAMQRLEAWIVVGQPEDGVPPSQSERRKEVVLVSLAGRVGGRVTRLSSVREILRGADGRPTGLAELDLPGQQGGGDLGGMAYEILPPVAPTPEQRSMARAALERLGAPGAV